MAPAHFNLGIALLKTGAAADATDAFREALRLRPDFAEAEFNLGNALLEQGDAAGAAASFERALSLKPGWVAASCNLGIARQRQGRLEAARAAYAAALAADPACFPRIVNSLTADATGELWLDFEALRRSLVARD